MGPAGSRGSAPGPWALAIGGTANADGRPPQLVAFCRMASGLDVAVPQSPTETADDDLLPR